MRCVIHSGPERRFPLSCRQSLCYPFVPPLAMKKRNAAAGTTLEKLYPRELLWHFLDGQTRPTDRLISRRLEKGSLERLS